MVDTQSLELGDHGFGLLLFNKKVHQGLGLSLTLYVQLRFHPESTPLRLRDVLSPYRIRVLPSHQLEYFEYNLTI